MAWQIQEAMDHPSLMYDGDGDYVYTFYPTAIFTEDSKTVITSILGSNYTC